MKVGQAVKQGWTGKGVSGVRYGVVTGVYDRVTPRTCNTFATVIWFDEDGETNPSNRLYRFSELTMLEPSLECQALNNVMSYQKTM